MEWSQVVAHPQLRDLSFKIELNEWGKIVMSPASNWHGNLQARIAMQLMRLMNAGEVSTEVSILTAKNVKVADVAWASEDFIARHGFETPYPAAPEICVEIISPGNSTGEMAEKKALYLASGAQEVWFCRENGEMEFFALSGRLAASALCSGFPVALARRAE